VANDFEFGQEKRGALPGRLFRVNAAQLTDRGRGGRMVVT
jgi:hypothetical protein